ncbi:MAG: 50S ribosomal protein L32 [Dongiaceae bacterium]
MFGIPSLGKLLVLVAIVAIVWFGFRLIGRLDQSRKDEARLKKRAGARRGSRAAETAATVEDTVKCPTCGAYVPARSASSCGRADCPY